MPHLKKANVIIMSVTEELGKVVLSLEVVGRRLLPVLVLFIESL